MLFYEDETDCKHKDTINSNGIEICVQCGIEFQDKIINMENETHFYGGNDTKTFKDPSRVYFRRIDNKNIYKDLDKYNLSIPIKEKTNKLYLQITNDKIYRGDIRIGIIFACVFNIYKDMDVIKTKDELNQIFNIKPKVITKGLKLFSQLKALNGEKVVSPSIQVEDYIGSVMEKFNSNKENIDKVRKLYEKIKNKSSEINSSKPHSVCCALVYYYCKSLNKEINITDFSKIVKLNELTIKKLTRIITNILETE